MTSARLLLRLARLASEALENQGVQLVLDIPIGIVLPLQRVRIQRVFNNLVSSAVEALSQGGEIRISAKRANKRVEVVLVDTGPGIPLSIRERLFEPFLTGKVGGWGSRCPVKRSSITAVRFGLSLEPGADS